MKKGIKKAIVYSLLIGMSQFGLATTAIIEASSRSDWQQHQQYRHHEGQRHQNYRHERQRQENYRQWVENQRHDNTMNEILAGIVGIAIGTQLQ